MTPRSVLFSLLLLAITYSAAVNAQQTASVTAVDPYPPYICQVNVTDSKGVTTVQNIAGPDSSSINFANVRKIKSPYCTCVGLAFDQVYFQGNYTQLNLPGGNTTYSLKFTAQSYFLSCAYGINKNAFKRVV